MSGGQLNATLMQLYQGEHGSHILLALTGGRKEDSRNRHLGAPAPEQAGEIKNSHGAFFEILKYNIQH
jgi:hypothetical protein